MTRQEILFGSLMHEVNTYSDVQINLHQLQRCLEALAYMHYGKARRILGEKAFAAFKEVLSNYQVEIRS